MPITQEQMRRHTAFWNFEPTDRACLSLTSWDGSPTFRAPASPEQQWGDMDYREEAILYNIEHTNFHAEAIPSVFTDFGPGSLTACIGGSYRFAPATVWFENQPFYVSDWDNYLPPKLETKSKMYRMIEDLTVRLLSHRDRLITSISDIGGTYDIIAALRGTENLLYDMYDAPEKIKAFRDEVAPIWKQYYFSYANRLIAAQGGMTTWMPIWSDKTYYTLQCDYSAMLSPQMFEEFILQDLREQTEYLERSIYHLDGPGELPHVDLLLSLPRLSVIQWTSGDGNPPVTDPCWFDLFRRIQAAGKGIVLLDADPSGLENLFRHVSQRGFFITSEVCDEKEADEIVEMAEKLNF